MADKASKGSLGVLIGMGPPKSDEGAEDDDAGSLGATALIKAVKSGSATDVKDAFRMLYDECKADHGSESEVLEE